MPTAKLDAENMNRYDFTVKKLQPIEFPSREGIGLSMDHRSLKKVVYSHSTELGIDSPANRISCPVQTDPNKFQRTDCWAITDKTIREAAVKILQFTTFDNPRIITVERFPSTCANQKATYFIDIVTGNAAYFRKGGKLDGKLWSMEHFEPYQVLDIITDPTVQAITDLSDYNFQL